MKYSAKWSQREAARKARRPKARRLDHAPLRKKVWELLRANWSPEQIAAMLPVLFPRDLRMRVSHETIYQSLFVQTKGELKRELTAHLRTQRQRRKAQTGGAKRVTLGITDDIRISARPAEAEDRAVPGHWEGDLLLGGTGKGAVLTLVERSSRFVLLAPLPGQHRADHARWTLNEMIATLPLGAAQVDHLGPRIRDGPARPVHHRVRHPDLLLRPPVAVAARHQREHQRPAAPVLAQGRQTCATSPWPSATRSPCS